MQNNTAQTLKIYWKYIKEYKISSFFVVAFIILANAAGTIAPIYYKKFFDALSSSQPDKNIIAATLISILISITLIELARWIFFRGAELVNNQLQPSIIGKLSNLCFSELHKHSFSYFNNNFVGSLVKRVNWFTRSFENIMDRIVWDFIPLFTNILIIVVVLLKRNTYLGLSIIAYLIIFLTINWLITNYKLKFDIERSEAETAATAILADTITNNHNVKLFVGYDREVSVFKNAIQKVRQLRVFTWNLDTIFNGVQGFLNIVLELGVMFFSVSLWKKNILTIGDIVLIQSYVATIYSQTWGFGKMIRNIFTNLADADEMTGILNTPIEVQNSPDAKNLVITKGEIEFINAGFNYNDTRNIISKFNLKIKDKEKVALVGSSGSGKTTIIKLLMRMYDLTMGSILIDGQKINAITKESLWENISLVPQDPILFHRPIMENIRYGRPNASDEEVIMAAKLAHCHEFISELPDGYNTYVGERGIKLSGGERQRVAIARAILRNAPILVLDEATSSLDSESEALIQEALGVLMKNKTVIVIAHRLSTIMKMDRIIVINKGKIIEEGTHADLLKKARGVYNNLWKIQAGGFITGDEDNTEKQIASQNEDEEDE